MGKVAMGLVIVLSIITNVVLIVLGVVNNEDFFQISLANILSLDITVFLSVLLVQNLLSKRRKNDFLVKILSEVSADLQDERLFNHGDNITASMLQKSIANRILFLFEACQKEGKETITYIKEHFKQMQTFYGDHGDVDVKDPFYEREKGNILDKIVKLQLELYGFNIKKIDERS